MMGPALMLFASGQETGEGGNEVLTAPSNLRVYSYQAGAKYGVSWTLGDNTASSELYRDDVLFSTLPPGVNNKDIGPKSDGTRQWKVRHIKSGDTSPFSASLSTVDGVVS